MVLKNGTLPVLKTFETVHTEVTFHFETIQGGKIYEKNDIRPLLLQPGVYAR